MDLVKIWHMKTFAKGVSGPDLGGPPFCQSGARYPAGGECFALLRKPTCGLPARSREVCEALSLGWKWPCLAIHVGNTFCIITRSNLVVDQANNMFPESSHLVLSLGNHPNGPKPHIYRKKCRNVTRNIDFFESSQNDDWKMPIYVIFDDEFNEMC